jgi:hypothetical protein
LAGGGARAPRPYRVLDRGMRVAYTKGELNPFVCSRPLASSEFTRMPPKY